jgi:hypothetical protein
VQPTGPTASGFSMVSTKLAFVVERQSLTATSPLTAAALTTGFLTFLDVFGWCSCDDSCEESNDDGVDLHVGEFEMVTC